MRSVFSIGFLCLFLLPHVGMWELLPVRVIEAKREAKRLIKHGIPASEQTFFRFSLYDTYTKLTWKHSREFRYEGEMYDILRTQMRGDSVWYWCYHDRKETEALKLYTESAQFAWNKIPTTDTRTVQVYYFFHHLFSPPELVSQTNMLLFDHHRVKFPYSIFISSLASVPLQPPPEFLPV